VSEITNSKGMPVASLEHNMLAISKQQNFKMVTEEHLENKGVAHSKMAEVGQASLAKDPYFYNMLWSSITPRARANFVPPPPLREWLEQMLAAPKQ
jgi:hypothetical protein